MPIKIGVIGVGYLGCHHARIYSEIEEAELIAVVDIDRTKADSLAKKYNCESIYDYRDILNRVDALSIVTPTTTHYSIACECLKAGKDLLIEKPITETVEEAEELIKLSKEKNCIIQVGHLERYNPAILSASELIAEPLFIESERMSPFFGRATDVDVTLDLMIHDIDIILSLLDASVKDIKAVGAKVLTEKIDVAKAWIDFDNGCTALSTVSRLSPEKRRLLKIFQKESFIAIDYQLSEITHYYMSGEKMLSEIIRPEKKEPLKEEIRDFLYCVKNRKRPRVSAKEGRNALDVVLKINKMIRS